MREKILKILEGKKNGLSFKTIRKRLYPRPAQEELAQVLEELIREGLLTRTKRGKYKKLKKPAQILEGEIQRFKGGYGFLLLKDQEDVFIPPRFMKGARTGDRVLVSLKPTRKGRRREGMVVKILERKQVVYTGYLVKKRKKKYVVIPDDESLGDELPLIGKPPIEKYEEGLRISFYVKGHKAKIKKVLGKDDDPEIDFLTVVEKYELPLEFPKRVKKALKNLQMPSKYKRRKDLRKEIIFTIDPKDAKDFDDAISVKLLPDGNFKLGVHIADVSYFVQEGGVLDKEAKKRGFSVYLINKVIPMLPEKLSNGLCSLNPGVDRLTMSVEMIIDREGRILEYEIFPSVIRSVARLSYEDAERLINDLDLEEDSVSVFAKGMFGKVKKALKIADQLTDILLKERERRRSIDIDLPEPEIILDKEGNIEKIEISPRLKSQKMIEEFMIRANVCVADFMARNNIPTVYRIHEEPDPQKLNAFFEAYEKLTGLKRVEEGEIHKRLYLMLQKITDERRRRVISYMLLRSLMRARYSIENKGHFGLALKYYLHFTSPIRRYPDLVVHRTLKKYLNKKLKISDKLIERLKEAAELSTRREEIAEKAEWDITDYKILGFLSQKVGEIFEGIIITIIDHGVFVNLPEFFFDGFIPLEAFGHKAKPDEEYTAVYVGNQKIVELGDEVMVRIKAVDKWRKRLDLELVGEQNNKKLKV